MSTQIKQLRQLDSSLVLSVIQSANNQNINATSPSFQSIGIEDFKSSKMRVISSEWFNPQDVGQFKIMPDAKIGFAVYFQIRNSIPLQPQYVDNSDASFEVKPNRRFYGIMMGSIKVKDVTNREVVLQNADDSVHISECIFNSDRETMDAEWEQIKSIISGSVETSLERAEVEKEFDKANEKIASGDYDDDQFMNWLHDLQKIHGLSDKRVWGEYDVVSALTNQPVLMAKSMAIQLNMEQSASLIANLSVRYKAKLNALVGKKKQLLRANNGLVPIHFSTNDRGHANPNLFEINLPNVGDWRCGYNQRWSAELIFHEFSHVLDFNNMTYSNITAHRQDFVNILDGVLVDYRDWIDRYYDKESHEKQFANFHGMTGDYHADKERFRDEATKAIKGKAERRIEEGKKAQEELGLSDNNYPLGVLINDDVQLDYLIYAVKNMKATTGEQFKMRTSLVSLLDSERMDAVLDNEQIAKIYTALDESNRNDFVRQLSFSSQLGAMEKVKEAEQNFNDLRSGVFGAKSDLPSNLKMSHAITRKRGKK